MERVVIVDYGLGNLHSVLHACRHVGLKAELSSKVSDIVESDAILLPGVGAFGDAMKNLDSLGLAAAILQHVTAKKPLFGICLGMQLLFGESEEFGVHRGLGILAGKVVRFPQNSQGERPLKVPHIGWNRLLEGARDSWLSTPLQDFSSEGYAYFVHSYYVIPEDERVILSLTDYGGNLFCSSVWVDNIFACQFHPEKSGKNGLSIYSRWADLIKKG